MSTPNTSLLENAIIFCGNGGAGKSYLCNRIFALHSVPTRFKSSASLKTVTSEIQFDTISCDGKKFTIVDTPGFFDNQSTTTSRKRTEQVDGENLCKLVEVLESCSVIVAIVFVFTDRFLLPQKLWYYRLLELLTVRRAGQIILLRNKTDTCDLSILLQNKSDVNKLIGLNDQSSSVPYFEIKFHPDDSHIQNILNQMTVLIPFSAEGLTLPQVCYEREEIGPSFKKLVPGSETTKDEGKMVTTTVQGFKRLKTTHYGGREFLLFGPRERWHTYKNVPTTTTAELWESKMVKRGQIGVYVKVSKVRWDGKKDCGDDREVDASLREEQILEVSEPKIINPNPPPTAEPDLPFDCKMQ